MTFEPNYSSYHFFPPPSPSPPLPPSPLSPPLPPPPLPPPPLPPLPPSSLPLPLPQAIYGLEELMKGADDLTLIAATGVLSVIQWTAVFLLPFIQVCFICYNSNYN